MIKSIEIEKFRGIENGKLDDFTPLTILVGPNSSGKSTVLDALFLGASYDPKKIISHFDHRNRQNMEVKWLIFQPFMNSEARIGLTSDEDGEGDSRFYKLILSLAESNHIDFHFFEKSNVRDNSSYNEIVMSYSDSGSSTSAKLMPHTGVSEITYVDFDQDQSSIPLVDLYTMSINLGHRTAAQKALNEILPGLVQVEIGTYKGQSRLQTVYEDSSVPLAAEGEGIQSLMRLSLSLSACADGTVLLEEPEVHQYPRSLRMSAKTIVSAVKRGVQVVISTHSLELIDALLIEAKEADALDKLSVYRLLLKDGCLKHSRTSGADAEFVRFQIEDDLR